MVLYHGSSNKDIEFFDLKHSRSTKNGLDFGKGVYLTTNFQQACSWSCHKNGVGAVYEFDIDLTELQLLDLTASDDFYYILCLCRTELEELVPEIEGYSESDAICGLMLDGVISEFRKYAELFMDGDISFIELVEKTNKYDANKNQTCIKSEKGILILNKSLRRIYYTSAGKVTETVNFK